jgi:hypothetical protein
MPDERDDDLERRVEEDAQRYPRHEDPDEAREDVGLGDESRRRGEPEGAPAPGREGRSAQER